MIDKVCPVVLRNQNQEILLFKHPLAGVQLVKGTVEVFDESYIIAAKRELAEESGITHVRSARYLCSWDSGFQIKYGILFCVSVLTSLIHGCFIRKTMVDMISRSSGTMSRAAFPRMHILCFSAGWKRYES